MTTESTPSSIVVRSYQLSDLSACQAVFTTAHLSYNNPILFTNTVLQTDMNDIQKNYLDVPNGHWWVAVSTNDNHVVGHVAALPLHLAEPSYYHQLPEGERDEIFELRRMAVAPDAQREGVGSKLLSALIDFARERGYRQVHLTTFPSMNKACAFYEKHGFIKGRIEKFSFDYDSLETIEDKKNLLNNQSKLVIFETGTLIPDEDLSLMKMSPIQSKFIYIQHYSLML
jgi:GNAT superfamily N-acetyltransferase